MTKNSTFRLIVIIVTVHFFAGCGNVTVSTGDGSEKITGNGKTVSESREVSSFKAISLEGAFNVTLEQTDKEAVKVEADENIIPTIITIVENDTLKVRMKDNKTIQNMGKLSVAISLVTISGINTEGAASLSSMDTLHLNGLDMNLQGAGATRLNLVADKLTINTGMAVTLFLAGKANEVKINQNGAGTIEAFNLKSEKLTLKTSGAGRAEVFASQELSIDASDATSVKYKGGATKNQIEKNGAAIVKCEDCK